MKRRIVFFLACVGLGAATVIACSSFDSTAPPTVADGGADTAAPAADVTVDAPDTDAADAGPVEAGPCTDTCNSHHCDADGGCHPLIFVTAGTYSGNLGGIVGADSICNTEATDAGKNADFVAILSSTGVGDALTRITGDQAPSRPVWQAGDLQVANDYADMFVAANLMNGISRTADDRVVPGGLYVWTGTSPTGAGFSGAECNDWATGDNSTNGVSGFTGATNATWIDNDGPGCAAFQHLYCAEITH